MTDWTNYHCSGFYDELIGTEAQPRPGGATLAAHLEGLSERQLKLRQEAAERAIVEMGVTFTVYTEGQNIDRAWPFDIIPRIIAANEWRQIEQGLRQRLTALNMFIDD
jgi:uncharacterized circularly permuted ATP-grasp superfamily protein